jgi:hypothetical protein
MHGVFSAGGPGFRFARVIDENADSIPDRSLAVLWGHEASFRGGKHKTRGGREGNQEKETDFLHNLRIAPWSMIFLDLS